VARPIRGDQREVANALASLARRGDLVSWTPRRHLPNGRIEVLARYVDRTQRTPDQTPLPMPEPVRRRVRVRWVVGGVAVGVGVGSGLGFAVYKVLVAVIPLLPAAFALLVLLALAWFLLGRAGACPGLHCPGCRHR
jgi:hypothetical protein